MLQEVAAMTRKRYIKLRMADGLTRNQATIEADAAALFGTPYSKKLSTQRLYTSELWTRLSQEEQEAYKALIMGGGGHD